MLRRLVREDVAIVIALAPDLQEVEADPGQLEQVLVNLVVNARDAMPRGGRLTIRTANVVCPREDPHGSAAAESAAEACVMLAVEDQGVGIPDDVRAKIFEPFFTTKPPGHGTGLGLSTVYGIVRQSGGSLTVESELGRGTTFSIYLPQLSRQRASTPAEPEPVRPPQASGGTTVLEALHGRDALEVCERTSTPPHLILTDMVMPEMSGFELGQRIAKTHPGVRILFMSGHTGDAAIRRGLAESGGAFLEKPFTPELLTAKVREVLEHRPIDPSLAGAAAWVRRGQG